MKRHPIPANRHRRDRRRRRDVPAQPRARAGKKAPGNKLNVALIGVWGRGLAISSLAGENVVALVRHRRGPFPNAQRSFPKAKTYVDWRKCLEQKDIDAVVICTADHTHAFIANWAIEPRHTCLLRKAAGHQRRGSPRCSRQLAEEKGQAGHASRHATPCVREFQPRPRNDPRRRHRRIAGRQRLGQSPDSPRPATLPAQGAPPEGFHFDLWLGPSPVILTTRAILPAAPA